MPAVPAVSYPDGMGPAPQADDAGTWAGQAADVPAEWFTHFSWLHGVRHTQRVHIHAQRLVHELRWPEDDAGVVLSAVLWHDIGRVDDNWDPQHGALSAAGQDDPERSLRILWLLKDADALDRVRLGGWEDPDPAQLRHPRAVPMIPFARELLRVFD